MRRRLRNLNFFRKLTQPFAIDIYPTAMSSTSTRKDLRTDEVQSGYNFLLENTLNGKLRRGAVK